MKIESKLGRALVGDRGEGESLPNDRERNSFAYNSTDLTPSNCIHLRQGKVQSTSAEASIASTTHLGNHGIKDIIYLKKKKK